MALTKIGKEGITGISNSSDATAITITSAENVGIGTTSPTAISNYTSVVANNSSGSMFELMVGGTRTANIQTSASQTNIQTRTSIPMVFDTNSTEAMRIDANGIITKPLQPAFSVHKNNSNQNNNAINTDVTVTFDTEAYDQNSDFASNTFTAPVTGKYFLSASIRLGQVDTSASFYSIQIITSNRTYKIIFDPNFSADLDYFTQTATIVADMDANDTAYIVFYQSGGAAITDIDGSSQWTYYSGYLLG